jgi:hypothetical protein
MRPVKCEFARIISACPVKSLLLSLVNRVENNLQLTRRYFLQPIHWQTIKPFQEAKIFSDRMSLNKPAIARARHCEQFIGEMAIENNACVSEDPQKGYTCRKLVDKIDIVFRSTPEEQVERQMELSQMGEEDMEFTP